MGYSKYYQVSSLRSARTNYKDYVRQVGTVSRPQLPGVIRTWFDSNDTMCFISQSGPVVKVVTEPYP